MFVVEILPESGAVVIGPREELLGRGVIAREINWLVSAPPTVGDEVQVQIRHHAPPVRGTLVRASADEIEIALDTTVAAITPGQSLVMYDGDRMLGGGVIERARRELPILAA